MDDLGTNFRSTSSVPDGKEASDMNRPEYDAVDQALARLYEDTPSLRFEKNWREAVRREEQTQMKQNRKNIWKKTVLPIAAALVLVLGANWAGQMEGMSDINAVMIPEGRSAKSAGDAGVNYSYSATNTSGMALMSAGKDYAVSEAADYEEAAYDAAAVSAGSGENGSQEIPATDHRKLIRTVDISLKTETFDADVEGIQQLLGQYGGYIENMHHNGEAGSYYGRSASLTMRVPSEHLDAFLTGLAGFGRVTSRSETTQDMTEQYTDNEARIQTLRTKLERLNTLLSQATRVSDILEIESEIADTQYQLERYESRQLNIDRKVDMSYVYVNVQETLVADDADDEELTLGQRLSAAFRASIEGLGRFGRNLLVFLVMAAPVIVPVALLVLAVKLIRKNRKGKENARPEEEMVYTYAPRDEGNETEE